MIIHTSRLLCLLTYGQVSLLEFDKKFNCMRAFLHSHIQISFRFLRVTNKFVYIYILAYNKFVYIYIRACTYRHGPLLKCEKQIRIYAHSCAQQICVHYALTDTDKFHFINVTNKFIYEPFYKV